MHITTLIMDIVKIMLFSPPGVVAMLFFPVLAIFKFFISMAFINEPYDLITTETIDQIFTFREIFLSADLKGAFIHNPPTKMVYFDFIHS